MKENNKFKKVMFQKDRTKLGKLDFYPAKLNIK